jgi:hypothetical protein
MGGGFRIRKKQLKRAGWQVVADKRIGEREHELVLQQTDGDQKTIKSSTRARAYRRAEQELVVKV